MIKEIFILICSGGILLLPLFFWLYILSIFTHLGVSRKQFLFGLGAGALSILPLLYDNIFVIGKIIEEVFFSLSFVSESFLGVSVAWNIGIFFLIILLFYFGIGKLVFRKTEVQKYIYSFLGFIFLLLFFGLFLYCISLFSGNTINSKTTVESGSFVFIGFLGVMSYYIVISLLEEGVKYIGNLGIISGKGTLSFSSMLASGAVVALGFAFFENILYTYSYVISSGIDGELLRIVFFRSLFTVALHVLCAMLISGGFYMLLMLRGKYNKAYILFFTFTVIGIISHAFFDVALTFGYIGIVFIYLFALYILVGYITSSE